jgi:hypothetical protein
MHGYQPSKKYRARRPTQKPKWALRRRNQKLWIKHRERSMKMLYQRVSWRSSLQLHPRHEWSPRVKYDRRTRLVRLRLLTKSRELRRGKFSHPVLPFLRNHVILPPLLNLNEDSLLDSGNRSSVFRAHLPNSQPIALHAGHQGLDRARRKSWQRIWRTACSILVLLVLVPAPLVLAPALLVQDPEFLAPQPLVAARIKR